MAPVSRTVRISAAGPGNAGAAARVSVSTNLSSVRSRAYTSVTGWSECWCTEVKLGRAEPVVRAVSM